MKKFEIPMFGTLVFYVEGNPKQIKNQVNQIMREYGFDFKNGQKLYDVEMREQHHGSTIILRKDPEVKGKQLSFTCYKAGVICYNTENRSVKIQYMDQKKDKISTICHEVRHVIDRLIKDHSIDDLETPAYLTGWLCSELLVNVI